MCGRFRLTSSEKYLADRFYARDDLNSLPRDNIALSQPVVTIRPDISKPHADSFNDALCANPVVG